jgi:hypothetical protein
MHEQRFGSDQVGGLSGAHMDLVSSYVEQAKGPPPRSALRFWVDGRWVEMASPEPESMVEELTAPVVPEPAAVEALAPAEPEAEPEGAPPSLLDAGGSGDEPDADPPLDLPIYRWFGAESAEQRAAPGWPRSLLGGRDA